MPSFDQILSAPTLFAERNVLSPHYVPADLPFRDKEIERIMVAVAPALEGQRSRNLFIYGKTGTGKTCTVRKVMEEFAARPSGARSAYINCRMYNSRYRVIQKLAKEFIPELDKSGFGLATLYEKLAEYVQEDAAKKKEGKEKGADAKTARPAGSPEPDEEQKAASKSSRISGADRAGRRLVVVLDEVDMVRDLDELIYTLTRMNDELTAGSLSIIGITNRLSFKDALDPRSKSSLCESEMVFVPYTAGQLQSILRQRADGGFKADCVDDSALNLAAAIAAQETGDARYALKLLLKAGELADERKLLRITDKEVEEARRNVDVDLATETIATLPAHQQLVLLAVCNLSLEGQRYQKLGSASGTMGGAGGGHLGAGGTQATWGGSGGAGGHASGNLASGPSGDANDHFLMSGEVYEEYSRVCRQHKKPKRSARWYREYLNDLEMLGLITTIESGRGMRGHTRLIKPGYAPEQMKKIIEKGQTIHGADDPLPDEKEAGAEDGRGDGTGGGGGANAGADGKGGHGREVLKPLPRFPKPGIWDG